MMSTLKPNIQRLSIELLKPGRYQPRQQFDEASLHELSLSLRSVGLVQPIVVRPLDKFYYEIIAGERRWRAAQLASFSEVDCLVKNYTDEQAIAASTIENINRVDLNPIEEAQAYKRFVEELHYTHDEIAAVVGKHRTHISNLLRLLTLEQSVQSWLKEGSLSEGHGKVLAGLHVTKQLYLAKKCVDKGWSVRQLEREIKQTNNMADGDKGRDPNIVHLERFLSERFGTEVKLEQEPQKKTGWLRLRYFNADTLDGLLDKLEKIGFSHDG